MLFVHLEAVSGHVQSLLESADPVMKENALRVYETLLVSTGSTISQAYLRPPLTACTCVGGRISRFRCRIIIIVILVNLFTFLLLDFCRDPSDEQLQSAVSRRPAPLASLPSSAAPANHRPPPLLLFLLLFCQSSWQQQQQQRRRRGGRGRGWCQEVCHGGCNGRHWSRQ